MDQAELDRVFFMPTRIQPFKQDARVSSPEDRLAMLALAAEDNADFRIAKVEIEREEVSYTIRSLRRLREMFPVGTDIRFIVGSDMFLNMEKWRDARALFREFPIIAGMRPGSDERAADYARKLESDFGASVIAVKNRMFDVSSAEIRARVRAGRSIRYLTPDKVEAYIRARKLYAEACEDA
jgi:nicotinate-nucleotide adenylyltransferase